MGHNRDIQDFWAELSPCDHVVQIYESTNGFIETLAKFVSEGFTVGDSVVIIATAEHRLALEQRLIELGFPEVTDPDNIQYIAVDAVDVMRNILVAQQPDEILFRKEILGLLARARSTGRRVRAFGEIVALMWANGYNGGTVRLEYLWHEFCRNEELTLFCAYPRSGFTKSADASIEEICALHSKVLPSLDEMTGPTSPV